MKHGFTMSISLAVLASACSSGSGGSSTGGTGGASGNGVLTCSPSNDATCYQAVFDGGVTCSYGDASYQSNCSYNAGFDQNSPNTPNTLGITYSGETLGVDGLPYVPNLNGDPVFVDGWSVQIIESLVVVGSLRLDPGATGSGTWQNVTAGPIAEQSPVVYRQGPFVMDAHRVGSYGLGKDGVEQASSLFVIPGLDNGQGFDTGTLYAFSYDTAQASWPVLNVNLDPSQLADYQLMVQNHWDKLIKGLATHTLTSPYGQGGGQPTPGSYPDSTIQAKFAQIPQAVYFAFGYDDHTTMYNCVNPDNAIDSSPSCSSDPIHCMAARGVQTNNNGMYAAQLTFHQDHLFWDTLEVEGEPLRFDPIAAWAPANTTEDNPFWLNNLTGQKLATTFADGTPLPDRGPFMTGNNLPFASDQTSTPVGCGGQPPCTGQVIMNTNGVTTVPQSGTQTPYPDFQEFSVQSQDHLNAQGICYIVGQHAADPFFDPNVATLPGTGVAQCVVADGGAACGSASEASGSAGSIGTSVGTSLSAAASTSSGAASGNTSGTSGTSATSTASSSGASSISTSGTTSAGSTGSTTAGGSSGTSTAGGSTTTG